MEFRQVGRSGWGDYNACWFDRDMERHGFPPKKLPMYLVQRDDGKFRILRDAAIGGKEMTLPFDTLEAAKAAYILIRESL